MRSRTHQFVKSKQEQQNPHHDWWLSQCYKLGGAKEEIGLNVLHEILEFDATFHETLPKELTCMKTK